MRFSTYFAPISLALALSVANPGLAEESPANASTPPAPSGLSCEFLRSPERTVIYDPEPEFAWRCGAGFNAYAQSAYRIKLQRTDLPEQDPQTLLWDSGRVASDQSINIKYGGSPLAAGGRYEWRVQSWNSQGEPSAWSDPQAFKMADEPSPLATSRYEVEASAESPTRVVELEAGEYLADFGRSAFGFLKLRFPTTTRESHTLSVRFGEKLKNGHIDHHPGGSIRSYLVKVQVPKGTTEFTIRPPLDDRNTSGSAIRLPESVGVVAPFRYAEVSGLPTPLESTHLDRVRFDYPFDESASSFDSSDDTLNAIWQLCKYSIRATTFCGVYIDGDRERIPYEADAYINQLCHYNVDSEYALARHSHEYLLHHPTWPTEWKQHSILMAWEDFLYTGNSESMQHHYNLLRREKLLLFAERPDGLLDTSEEGFRDIVDWPAGERDHYDMCDVNTVVNAFHYATLIRMSSIAEVLGKSEDSELFERKAESLKLEFNRQFWDEERGLYVDGLGSQHCSLHANLFPLAFDLVPVDRVDSVVAFLEAQGMRCSVYPAQYLLEGLYTNDQSEQALSLLCSKKKRSWYNMIRAGSTITLEAWDREYKPNLDWNHAWGAAPANLIPRYLVGVRPVEPGFRKFVVQPRPGSLESFSAKVPSIRGAIEVSYSASGDGYKLKVAVPGNSTARVGLPLLAGKPPVHVTHNGKPIELRSEGQHCWIEEVAPGTHVFDASLTAPQASQVLRTRTLNLLTKNR
ncbi:family 78 glycoside hydrolase catalytic domain [Aeoliella sp. ICT_H6.2]|uniref:alpha-L-rhamnosidase n=1 Tax=Aeoliella straminimaris TaxID=2954799 RepID=A0A9X2F6P9_9BACT|nr:alpha-L-rhamnosidase C-terminal domain-containing protein [Aeoliella straminimaris]MCO6043280.1 family 78 glycoside hydrolase catalytic domain [Aeoliella straminimaris]